MGKHIGALVAAIMITSAFAAEVQAERLVILTTNDTHSQIDPDSDGRGGVLRRRAIIDSVRAAEKNVLLLDAGDVVQGTLYFTLFGGEVETAMLDSLGYDACTLGNHEFDNGMEPLAKCYKTMSTARLSANYGLEGTPLEGLLEPYLIKQYGGRKIAVVGINLLPDGMIAPANCEGVVYRNSRETANAIAAELKGGGKADFVILLTHVGYKGGSTQDPSDVTIAQSSTDVDLIVGGHSHTTVDPADPKSEDWIVSNADGIGIPVTQTGSSGKNVGYILLDLDAMTVEEYRLIPVDKHWDDRAIYPALDAYLAPYREKVDSLMNSPLIYSVEALERGGIPLANFTADATYEIACSLYDGQVDFAIMNNGGIRQPMPQGDVSEGLIRSMYPFDNKLVVIEVTGQQLMDALAIMATRGGDPVSSQVRVAFERGEPGTKAVVKSATVDGKTITATATYKVATIDYLANGGDYMTPLASCPRLYEDLSKIGDRIVDYLRLQAQAGATIDPSKEPRMTDLNPTPPPAR